MLALEGQHKVAFRSEGEASIENINLGGLDLSESVRIFNISTIFSNLEDIFVTMAYTYESIHSPDASRRIGHRCVTFSALLLLPGRTEGRGRDKQFPR